MTRLSQGLLQVYTGEGKGKTTAATGLLVRALGQGWRVLLARNYLPVERLLDFLDQRPGEMEVVCTGRRAPEELLERADLVTRMAKVRHPYDAGIPAREGIEY